MDFVFNARGDYKTEFVLYVNQLWEQVKELTADQRVALTKKLTESYFLATNKMPDGRQLDRLSSFVLYHDEIHENDPYKSQKTGILTGTQTKRRKGKNESDFTMADQYGTDGVKHGSGKRNKRTGNLE